MNIKELETVQQLPANKRYEYFIKKVVDLEKVWGLYKDGWAMSEDDSGKVFIPFWPRKEFAQICMKGYWENYTPTDIRLNIFLERWLPGMENDGIKPAIFMTNQDKGVFVDINRLLNDLNRELEKY